MISAIHLKDGSVIHLNPRDPDHAHTATEGRLGITVHCSTTGSGKRIPWRKIRNINRHVF